MTKNDVQIYFLQNAKSIDNETGFVHLKNGLKLRVFAPFEYLRGIESARKNKYTVQM